MLSGRGRARVLTDETDEMLGRYVKETYYNRCGALSITVEAALQNFLRRNGIKPRSQ